MLTSLKSHALPFVYMNGRRYQGSTGLYHLPNDIVRNLPNPRLLARPPNPLFLRNRGSRRKHGLPWQSGSYAARMCACRRLYLGRDGSPGAPAPHLGGDHGRPTLSRAPASDQSDPRPRRRNRDRQYVFLFFVTVSFPGLTPSPPPVHAQSTTRATLRVCGWDGKEAYAATHT